MEVRGAEVSGRIVSSAAGGWASGRTEENLFDVETLAKAEAQLQTVVEWEEEEKVETVCADDSAGR